MLGPDGEYGWVRFGTGQLVRYSNGHLVTYSPLTDPFKTEAAWLREKALRKKLLEKKSEGLHPSIKMELDKLRRIQIWDSEVKARLKELVS